jgi:hypothetical protein
MSAYVKLMLMWVIHPNKVMYLTSGIINIGPHYIQDIVAWILNFGIRVGFCYFFMGGDSFWHEIFILIFVDICGSTLK